MRMIHGVATVDGDTHIAEWVRQQRTLNIARGMLDPLRQYLPEGGCVVDAGANIGDHSYYYAKAVGESGKVIAFEPNPDAYECLRYNMLKNRLDSTVEIHMIGLSDSHGFTTLHDEKNVGASWMHRDPVEGGKEVIFDTLDAMRLSSLHFFKLDIEGWELRALHGAKKTIEKFRPVLLMEVNAGALERAGTSRDELLGLVESLGYVWRIHGGGVRTDPQFDIFCRPKEKSEP